jgi:hypothetical protein
MNNAMPIRVVAIVGGYRATWMQGGKLRVVQTEGRRALAIRFARAAQELIAAGVPS